MIVLISLPNKRNKFGGTKLRKRKRERKNEVLNKRKRLMEKTYTR